MVNVVLCLLQTTMMMALCATAASLSGSATITPQDYYGLPVNALENNPPACGMPYAQLNLALITAVEAMDTAFTCNLCLNVTNQDQSRSIYVLAVDLGGSGLDLSIPAFEYLFDQRYDASPASWSTVDDSYCAGIYTPGETNPNQGIDAGSSSTTTTSKAATSTTGSTTTSTKVTTAATETETPITKTTATAQAVTTTTITVAASATTATTTTTTTTTTSEPSPSITDRPYHRHPERRRRRHRKQNTRRSTSWISLW
ncbi:hypothetical protein BDB00DRAFT_406077 [Zychaea mexicana]|uniref:uncharacterized protein n=1 Tax=Zychaea mexicana TaxID=64656 RepID=UPI0022FEA870|nr:uncharacterized protein BDB00DRAFT_406077 [Zychaea mexicana]KAI9493035.1 hypothetical protein BDB00DRAFT_406077 [Zychaea mexicana]